MQSISTKNLHLSSLLGLLEKNKLLIATYWVQQKDVKSVFHTRAISTKKFRDNYAISIIDYFIDVVNGRQKIGNCPVMSKFVNYLIVKDITPKEVFIICMGFRKILVKFLLKNEIVLKNPSVFLDEMSFIFDKNLSGVLEIFTDIYADLQKKIEISKSKKYKLQQILKIMDLIDFKLIIVQNSKIILANKAFLKVVGVENLKELYLKYECGFGFFNDIEDYKNIFENETTFKTSIYNEKEKHNYYFSGHTAKMPLEEKQFIVTLNDITESIDKEKLLKDTLHNDSLTGFRNYPTFEKLVSQQVVEAKDSDVRLFLAVVDIPNLREINEKESRQYGDKVILEIANNLRTFVNKNVYLARLEGSRFGILLRDENEQSVYDWSISLLKKLNKTKERKTLSVTEIDFGESINKAFLRVYNLIEVCNNSEDIDIETDFKEIIRYKNLPEQLEFTKRISKLKSLKISLYYMELPISNECEILEVTTNKVKLKISSKQFKIAKIDMFVYFNLNLIGNIKGSIKSIDYDKSEIYIDRFRFDKHSPLNRKKYRICVQENEIKGYISYNNRDFKVDILDMNDECIAVKIDRKRNFDINTVIYIDMLLPLSDRVDSCNCNASLIKIEAFDGGYKLVLLCHLDTQNAELLNKYIVKTQMEIVKSFS